MFCGMSSPADDPRDRFDPATVDLLRCPVTQSRLRRDGDWLVAEVGGLAYPIRNGIAVMVPESARLPPGVSSLEQIKAEFRVRNGDR